MEHSTSRARTRRALLVSACFLCVFITIGFLLEPETRRDYPELTLTLILFLALAVLVFFDLRYYRLPNILTYGLILLGLCYHAASNSESILDALLGTVLGYAIIYAVQLYTRLRTGKPGIGLGDAKLFAASGAWLGALNLPYVFLISSLAALMIVSINALILRSMPRRDLKIAFGPFICLAFWIGWCMDWRPGELL
jgi:leader peptidase (prepilin peptidase)/N-methyltransferase